MQRRFAERVKDCLDPNGILASQAGHLASKLQVIAPAGVTCAWPTSEKVATLFRGNANFLLRRLSGVIVSSRMRLSVAWNTALAIAGSPHHGDLADAFHAQRMTCGSCSSATADDAHGALNGAGCSTG